MSSTLTLALRSMPAFVLFLVIASGGTALGGEDEHLPRSFYVPLELELCEHLHDAVLKLGGRAVSHVPAKRIFQFTYYPKLNRIEPLRTDVEVVGVRDDGESFLARLAVTPWGVFTANQKVELDLDAQLARMRYKIDVRYEPTFLRLRCSDRCERSEPEAERDSAEAEQEVGR